ncbi:hypothetical protein AEGHOMDF_5946 [Methylobacterium soli]|nr:hypothetical protein AEGHOMDF_5946 [Methylobacterium soli]
MSEEEEWTQSLWATDAAMVLILGGVLIFAVGVLMLHFAN